jgi:integrase
MTDISHYPGCLQRPDAGGHIQTRSTQSEHGYRERYLGMTKTLCRKLGMDVVSVADLAIDIGHRASRLKPNALKMYHACVRQHLRDLWDEDSITLEEIERIDTLMRDQVPRSKTAKGKQMSTTSSGRAKSVKPETLSALVSQLLASDTSIRRIAAALLEYGVELATRPGEFLTLSEDHRGRLWVCSAKYSKINGKGLLPLRMPIVDHLEPFEIEELRFIAALIKAERENGATTSKLLRRCQHAIREARNVVRGRSKKVTAYTVRHQARANMAAMGMTPAEVAVVMNHASADTALSHYSPARRAWKHSESAKPPALDPDLVAKVRPGNRTRGWTAGQSTGPKPK